MVHKSHTVQGWYILEECCHVPTGFFNIWKGMENNAHALEGRFVKCQQALIAGGAQQFT